MLEKKTTILIVDDEEEIIDLLKDHFEGRNCVTITTQDPTTVVNKLKNIQINLMFLDLKMRDMNGFQVLDAIKKEGLALPPTIIITGYLDKFKNSLRENGIDVNKDVILKPFNFSEIEKMINQKLGTQILVDEVGS